MIQDVFGKHFEVTNWKLPVFQDHLLGLVVGHTYFFFEELVELAVFIGEASEHVFPVQDVYPLMSTSQGFRLFRTPRILKMAGEPDCPLVIS
jgi:hypothetical protein